MTGHKYEKKLKDKNNQLNRMNFFSHIKITYYLCFSNKKNNL